MAFDPERNKVLLFGGNTLDLGTWEWDGEYWTQVSDMGPPLRRDARMAWDYPSKRVLLFGGVEKDIVPGQDPGTFGDTWGWDGVNWTQLDDTGPAARFEFGLASDPARQRIILFGGTQYLGVNPKALGDTWEWDGTEWTQVEETGPIPRRRHSMTFDGIRQRAVLFAGMNNEGAAQADTWEWTGTAWMRVSEFGPGRRLSAEMSFDGSQSILFGGNLIVGEGGSIAGDTWSWDGKFWTQRQDIGPKPRAHHAMAFDSARKKVVLFGGGGNAPTDFGDTWELSLHT